MYQPLDEVIFMSMLIKSFEVSKEKELTDEALLKKITAGSCGCAGKRITQEVVDGSIKYSVDDA
ncbi:hypothetical protein [Alkalimonas sp.]|uniref:hypothetical protein n=1 Tax=Alkalimonas sp. TaxID=1872453 RepID=UPI00263A5485|nr:hypothetical protein [Alkalimonas sp.]MCC5827231.1 hypothetical protein [Alkalimonas sp.]